jgi:hypothetical protein
MLESNIEVYVAMSLLSMIFISYLHAYYIPSLIAEQLP